MIPLKIQQKLTYIKNRIETFNYTDKQIDKFNSILNECCYELDYSLVVEGVKKK